MAIKSTIFKADLQVSDTDRDYYEAHKLTLARHPSETDERTMQLTCMIQDKQLTLSDKNHEAIIEPEVWLEPKPAIGR